MLKTTLMAAVAAAALAVPAIAKQTNHVQVLPDGGQLITTIVVEGHINAPSITSTVVTQCSPAPVRCTVVSQNANSGNLLSGILTGSVAAAVLRPAETRISNDSSSSSRNSTRVSNNTDVDVHNSNRQDQGQLQGQLQGQEQTARGGSATASAGAYADADAQNSNSNGNTNVNSNDNDLRGTNTNVNGNTNNNSSSGGCPGNSCHD